MQEKNIEKQKTLLKHMETRRRKYIEDYNTKVKRETARMQSKVAHKVRIKNTNLRNLYDTRSYLQYTFLIYNILFTERLDNEKLFTYCYVKKRHLLDGSSRICCKKYLRKNTVK